MSDQSAKQHVVRSVALWIVLISVTVTGWIFSAYLWFNQARPNSANPTLEFLRSFGSGVTPAPAALRYEEFVAILLTAIGVLIALLALILALAAVWGFSGIKEIIVSSASKIAFETAQKVAKEVSETTSVRTAASMSEASWDEPKNQTDGDYGEAAAMENGNDGTNGKPAAN